MLYHGEMRLQEQLSILQRVTPVMTAIQWQTQPDGMVHAQNKAAVAGALKELTRLPYFAKFAHELLSHHTFETKAPTIVLSREAHAKWAATQSVLAMVLPPLQGVMRTAVAATGEHSIAVRLPQMTSLADVSSAISDLERVLSPIVESKKAEAKIEVEGFDSGSMWLVIAIGSAVGLAIIRGICKAAKEVMSLELEAERNRLSLKRMGVEGSVLDAIHEQVQKTRRAQLKELAEAIERQDFDEHPDNERIARIELSIDLLAKLNKSGGEIRPAIEPIKADSAKDNYPDIQALLKANRREIEAMQAKLLGPAVVSIATESKG
jgi:hypothetical protein